MDNIIELAINLLKDNDTWFTTKNDPTIDEPSYYYELDKYGELTNSGKDKVEKDIKSYVGDGAICLDDAVEMWFNDSLCEFRIDYLDNLKTKFEPKPVIDQIEAYEVPLDNKQSIKTEGFKTRLREENSRSREVLDKILNDSSFDSDSNEGKMVLKAQEIFNKLSDLGYDLQVTVDNGDAELDILLSQQGGKAIITINSGNQQIKAFASGNFELTEANIEVLQNIQQQLKNL